LEFFSIIKLGAAWFDAKKIIGPMSAQAPKNWLSIGWLPNFLPVSLGCQILVLPEDCYQTSLPILYQLSNFGFAKKNGLPERPFGCKNKHAQTK
jgi:hypothetical protein